MRFVDHSKDEICSVLVKIFVLIPMTSNEKMQMHIEYERSFPHVNFVNINKFRIQ